MGPGQLEERAEQIRSKSHLIQVEREKMQMELSHKRARVELERAASASARSYEVGAGEPAPEHGGVCRACQPMGSKPPAGAEVHPLSSWAPQGFGSALGGVLGPQGRHHEGLAAELRCLRRCWWALSAGHLVALSARVGIQVWQECPVAWVWLESHQLA